MGSFTVVHLCSNFNIVSVVFQVDALERFVIGVDSEASAVLVGVKFLAAINDSEELSFNIGIPFFNICKGSSGESDWFAILCECCTKAFHCCINLKVVSFFGSKYVRVTALLMESLMPLKASCAGYHLSESVFFFQ